MPDLVAAWLNANEKHRVILALEGESRTVAVMLGMMIVAMYVPILIATGFTESLLSATSLAAVVLLFVTAVYWSLSRAPTDVVVAEGNLHLFWRLFSRVRHEGIPLAAISGVEIGPIGAFSGVSAVVVRRQGRESLVLKLMRSTRWGIWPCYKVILNESGHAFDGNIRDANHNPAFLALLDGLTRRDGKAGGP